MSEWPKFRYRQVCPKCGENAAADGGPVEINGAVAWQEVTCRCGARYVEVYRYSCTELYEDWDEECEDDER